MRRIRSSLLLFLSLLLLCLASPLRAFELRGARATLVHLSRQLHTDRGFLLKKLLHGMKQANERDTRTLFDDVRGSGRRGYESGHDDEDETHGQSAELLEMRASSAASNYRASPPRKVSIPEGLAKSASAISAAKSLNDISHLSSTYANAVLLENKSTASSVWGNAWKIVDDMFGTKSSSPSSSAAPSDAVALEIDATAQTSSMVQDDNGALIEVPVHHATEADLAGQILEKQMDPMIEETLAPQDGADKVDLVALEQEASVSAHIAKGTSRMEAMEQRAVQRSRSLARLAAQAHAKQKGKSKGLPWILKKQFLIEDCTACQYIWKQVEMDVGGVWSWQPVQESFEHNCLDAQQTGIFYSACKDMYADLVEMVKDYLSNKFTVKDMCKRAKMCGWDDPGILPRKTKEPQIDVWPRISQVPLPPEKDKLKAQLLKDP